MLPSFIQFLFVEMKCILFLLTVCILNEIIYGLNQASTETEEDDEEYDEGTGYDNGDDLGMLEESLNSVDYQAFSKLNQASTETEEDDEEYDEGTGYDNGDDLGMLEESLNSVDYQAFSKETLDSFNHELELGNPSDLFATNNRIFQPNEYKDLGRRFVLQYPYSDVKPKEEDKLMPKKAPPEVVLAVAKESALLEASKPVNPSEHIMTDANILRNGDYWNGVWQENINPQSQLRSKNLKKHKFTTVKAKIMPGSDLHELISKLTRISPRLLYVINKESKH